MRPAQHFEILYASASDRLQRLRNVANAALKKPNSHFAEVNREISYITIEMHTLAANFARAYFLSSVLSPITKSGVRIYCNPIISNFNDALNAAMKRCKNKIWLTGKWNRRDEPPWHQPTILINCIDEIDCSNIASVKTAFSIATTPVFEHLTKFRIFYAHRNSETILEPKNIAFYYSITENKHPSKILCLPAYGRPQALILDWMDDMSNVIDLLCQ